MWYVSENGKQLENAKSISIATISILINSIVHFDKRPFEIHAKRDDPII